MPEVTPNNIEIGKTYEARSRGGNVVRGRVTAMTNGKILFGNSLSLFIHGWTFYSTEPEIEIPEHFREYRSMMRGGTSPGKIEFAALVPTMVDGPLDRAMIGEDREDAEESRLYYGQRKIRNALITRTIPGWHLLDLETFD